MGNKMLAGVQVVMDQNNIQVTRGEGGKTTYSIEIDPSQMTSECMVFLVMPNRGQAESDVNPNPEEPLRYSATPEKDVLKAFQSLRGVMGIHLDGLMKMTQLGCSNVLSGIYNLRGEGYKITESQDAEGIYTLHNERK